MKLTGRLETCGLGIVDKKEKILIVSDFHIGIEEGLNKEGVLVPRFQFSGIMKKLECIFKKNKIKKGIINGDLKHEFGTISGQEWRETLKVIDLMSKNCEEVILVKGNHDTILGPIAGKRNVRIVDEYRYGRTLVVHGHRIPEKLEETIVIGHEHPAVAIREGARVELFKCFLRGKFRGKTLVVQPSFSLVTEGTDVLREKRLSPFLQGDMGDFEVFVAEGDKVYSFGKLRNLSLKR